MKTMNVKLRGKSKRATRCRGVAVYARVVTFL